MPGQYLRHRRMSRTPEPLREADRPAQLGLGIHLPAVGAVDAGQPGALEG
jgi:hypothetical protein